MKFLDSDNLCPDCGQAMQQLIEITPGEIETPDGLSQYSEVFICWNCKITRWYRAERPTAYTYESGDKYAAKIRQYPRLKDKSRELWQAIWQEFDRQKPPMTVRQMFYRMSSQGHVDKTENGYRRVQHALAEMREKSAIPYRYIADNTRWVRKPRTFASLIDAMEEMQTLYRRELWSRQPSYIEIWLEKDALAGVLYDITEEYDVPLYVTRGYPSLSYLYEASESLKEIDKPIYIYHFGDYDASGQDAARSINEGLRKFGLHFEFIQAAVQPEQITRYKLQTRPAKSSDPRAAKHGNLAVELDAIEPMQLRQMVREIIENHIDHAELARVQQIQDAERSTIEGMITAFQTQPASIPRPQRSKLSDVPSSERAGLAKIAGVTEDDLIMVEYLENHAPDEIRAKSRHGKLTIKQAYMLAKSLEKVPQEVKVLALRVADDSVDKVRILNDLHKHGGHDGIPLIFRQIERTGGFDYGSSLDKWLNFSEASVIDILKALE